MRFIFAGITTGITATTAATMGLAMAFRSSHSDLAATATTITSAIMAASAIEASDTVASDMAAITAITNFR